LKRFWNSAEAAPDDRDAGWRVLLDGKPMRLPGGTPLLVERRALAEAIADEWRVAGGEIGGEMSYRDVPLTRLAGTAQERIAPDAEPVILEISRYGESDLLCYRAEMPEALVRRQAAAWDPWLDWAAETLGARLLVTNGIVHVAQEPAAMAVLARAVARYDAAGLAALGVLVPSLGSLVLGLAVARGALAAEDAYAASAIDETFQAELWGEDAEAAARRRQAREDVLLAGRFLALCAPAGGEDQ
jgi:chaperone required for assembly of F1-ATPase